MRLVIRAADDVAELVQARQVIDALLHSLRSLDPVPSQPLPGSRAARPLREVLAARAANALAASGITTLDALSACSAADLMRLRGFGRRSLDEVTGALEATGRHLQPDTQE